MKTKHSILIVDDDADDREIIRDAFEASREGQDYIFLDDGDKLLDYLAKFAESLPPSLIMLDLNLPGRDGKEILRLLKSNQRLRFIPVVIFTTSSSHRDRETAYELGANCFVTKPDTFNKLIELASAVSRLWLV